MEISSISKKILQILVGRYEAGCTLEELTTLLISSIDSPFTDKSAVEKENHAKILEALIILNDKGLIFLNSNTDQSFITIKGLMEVNYKVLCN